MKCSKCGLENKPESKVCEGCGNKLKKGNVAKIITIIFVVCLCIYLTGINVYSIIEYGEPAGLFPKFNKVEEVEKNNKKSTKKEEKNDNNDEKKKIEETIKNNNNIYMKLKMVI